MNTMIRIAIVFLALFFFETGSSQSENSDCSDHPVVTRFPGALITYCDIRNYSEFSIPTGPETGYRTIDDWIQVAGKHTRIYYSIEGDIIVSEIYKNYLTAFKNNTFTLLAHQMHQERNNSKEVGGNTWLGSFFRANPFPTNVGIRITQGSGTMGGTFYIATKKDNIYITVSGKRYTDNESVVLLDIIETQEMVDNLIEINADFIADKLFKDGKITLPGILFDHNQATVKEESKEILGEIALFLKTNPKVVVYVVGHTDMTGEFQYNMDLSTKRTKAVANYLTNRHQIDPGRLLPYGIGPLAPVDNNSTESGKQKNRRVELVLKSR